MFPFARYFFTILCLGIVHNLGLFNCFSDENQKMIDLGEGVQIQNNFEGFDYFTNSWTVLGLTNYDRGTRVSPEGELVLADNLICCPLIGKEMVSLNDSVKRVLLHGCLPIVQYDFIAGKTIRYEIEMLACPEPEDNPNFHWPEEKSFINLMKVKLTNLRFEPCTGYFHWEWSGENVTVDSIADIQDHPRECCIVTPERLLGVIHFPENREVVQDGNRVGIRAKLEVNGGVEFYIRIPFFAYERSNQQKQQMLAGMDYDRWHEKTVAYWKNLLEKGTRLKIPEEKTIDTYKTSLVYQFIGQDHGEIHAGEGFYDELYLRDAAYQAISLVHAGYPEDAKKGLEFFLQNQKEDGQFITQKGQLDAHGYSMWALVEYYRLTHDWEWLEKVYPSIKKAVKWLQQKRRTETDPNSQFYGILPNAIADGEYLWNGEYHIAGYDWQNLRGLRSAVEAAKVLGKEANANEWQKEFQDYKQCILRALEATSLDYIPPSYETAGTHWGNLEVIFPSVLLDPQHSLIGNTLDVVHNEFGGGFKEGVIRWSPGREEPAIHPYMSQFVTNTHIIRGECEKAIDGFYAFLLHTTSTNGLPEGVHYEKQEAWNNTLPHLWAAALYVTTLRNMVVREQKDEIHLLSCIPLHWLDSGQRILIEEAYTHFGKTGFWVNAKEETLQVTINPPRRNPPARMVVHFPNDLKIEAVVMNGKEIPVSLNGSVVLEQEHLSQPFDLNVKIQRPEQLETMSFQAKVSSFKGNSK